MRNPAVSVILPVFNEEPGLPALFARLYPALDALAVPYEVIFINDGSQDRSAALLRTQFEARPDVTRVILFNANYGQHLAIVAGFQHALGERVVTLDADLQNPPEEIGKLLAKMDQGHDYVGGVRTIRRDTWFRRNVSRLLNGLRERTTRIHMTDQGCMLRAYDRNIVNAVNRCEEINTYIPALAYTFASNPAEISVAHEERSAGTTKYSLYKLMRLNFDLVTGFSLAPLQAFSAIGLTLAIGSMSFVIFQIGHRLVRGSAAEGVFPSVMDGLEFFLAGVTLFGIGLLGEYIGRIYQQVLRRPRFIVSAVLQEKRAFDRQYRAADHFSRARVDPLRMTDAVVFAYHDVGARCLETLLSHGVKVRLVVTHDDDPRENIWFASVAALARLHAIPTVTPAHPNTVELTQRIAALRPDFLFSFYYRQMLGQPLLDIARLGALNMHGSLLPKYRGRAPVNWAVINGERETGATLHYMTAKPDAGDIVDSQAVPIFADDAAVDVFRKVTGAAQVVLDRSLQRLIDGTALRIAQNHAQATYFGGRKPEDGRIDWSKRAADVHNLVRGVAPPYPGAFTSFAGKPARVLKTLREPAPGPYTQPVLFAHDGRCYAQCGDGALLRLASVEINGQLLREEDMANVIGGDPVPLSTSIQETA